MAALLVVLAALVLVQLVVSVVEVRCHGQRFAYCSFQNRTSPCTHLQSGCLSVCGGRVAGDTFKLSVVGSRLLLGKTKHKDNVGTRAGRASHPCTAIITKQKKQLCASKG